MRNVKSTDEYHVVELFESQVNKTPRHIAINDNGKHYNYATLNEKANQFAQCLRKYHVKPGEFVGVLLEPGVDFIISILAVVKLGAVYLPLDALAPQRRLVEILEDAKPKIVITNDQYRFLINEETNEVRLVKNLNMESISYPRENLNGVISPKAPLYMMYTSGSTGKPKGVIIPHQAVINLVKIQNDFQLQEGDVIAQFSNLAFDASPFEVWSALLNGAHLAVVPLEIRTDPTQFKRFIEEQRVRFLCLPTGFFHQIIKSAADTLNEIRVIVFGGEQVNASLLKKFLSYRKEKALPIELINGYGPTETTAYTCRKRMNEQSILLDEQLSSIGMPIDNALMYVLDEHKNLVSEGELYVSGINLALGYHNSQQNNEKFITNPFNQEEPFQQLYKTGDKVRQLPSGELLFLGRFDDQVKIGGFRIHLNEIEKQLMRYPGISLAAVKVEIGGGSHKMLTAYIILSDKEAVVSADEMRQFLSDVLPSYMLPAKYVKVDELPLTLVGKVDKSKLDTLPHTDLSFHMDTSSSSVIEEKIKKIWQHLLNRTSIDTNKNLFELGANSLLITEACAKINKELHSELYVADILSHPTIYKLSCYLEGQVEVPAVKIIKEADTNDIAIIGMACRFPGAHSLQEYWDNLCQGKESLERFTEEQLGDSVNKNKFSERNFVPVRGVLAGIDEFDANFFGFNPGDAHIADPQQRVFLECAWEALEHAAIAPNKLKNNTISVFAGMSDSTYLQENLLKSNWFKQEHDVLQQRIACSTSMLSTQVSYRLNLKGRSLNVNTACSTGLITVDQACQDLILGESDIALAGAASIVIPQADGYMYQKGSIVSPDGHCRPFSAAANGTVFSNGVGVVILKRLSDAMTDGDTIYAVINGRGVNNDGSDKLGFTAPSTSGQMSCIRDALGQAKIKAEEVSYLEAHGTATALGDVIEIGALTSVYREQTEKKQFCFLGSVKGNIGHTDVTAGIAGLIKTALCLHYRKIPPLCGFSEPNPNLLLKESPFVINTQVHDWSVNSAKRYAGVSSFGVGGTNIHMVLSEHVPESTPPAVTKEQLIVVSAKTENALKQNTHKLLDYLAAQEQEDQLNLADAAYTLQTGRDDFQWRHFGVGTTVAELTQSISRNSMSMCDEHTHQNLVFMFPGQGMQYHLMAMDLMKKIPLFALLIEQGMSLAKNYLNCDLLQIIGDPDDVRLNQTQYAQPALFIIEYALAQLLISYGVKPDALIGHSVGEYVAACLAGVFSFEDAIVIVCERGLLMANAERGEMLAIECTEQEFALYQNSIPVELALHNAPNHCVASGSSVDIAMLEHHLTGLGTRYQKLKVSHAFHSRLMASVEKPFKEMLSNISLSAPLIPIISNVTGTWLSAENATDPDYWYRHLRHTVKFCDGLHTLTADARTFFVEVGPGCGLSTFIKEVIRTHNNIAHITHVLPNYRRQTGDFQQLLLALGELWQKGVNIDWHSLGGNEKRQRIPLPTYSFQRQRYWIEPDDRGGPLPGQEALYKPVWSHQPAYFDSHFVDTQVLQQYNWIVFKDKKGVADQILGFLYEHAVQPIIVESGIDYCEKSPSHFEINVAQKAHYEALFTTLKNSIHNPIIVHVSSCNNQSDGLLPIHDIESQLESGFHSILYLTQAYLEQLGEQIPLKCAVITTGTHQVTGTEKMAPVNASLLGPCRVIMQEHPAFKYRLLDINSEELSFYNEPLLSHFIHSCVYEEWDSMRPVIAYRNGYRWEVSYSEIKQATEKRNRFKDGGIYLFTGGMGGMALSLCEAIAKKVTQPQFILISRSPVISESEWPNVLQDPQHPLHEKVTLLKKLQDLGAILFLHQADVTQFDSLSSVINYYKKELGTINGVIHAAGVAGNGLVQLKTKHQAQDVLLPKIQGTYNLALALRGLSLDFVALMSSIAAVTGEKGQVDYCGANASLDAFAASRLFSARFVVSLNWNTWRDVGMTVETQRPEDINYFNRGNDISPQQGQQLFLQAMEHHSANVIVSNYEPERYATMLLQTHEPVQSSRIKMTRHDVNVTVNYQAPENNIEEQLAFLWQDNLGIETIGRHDDFFALGGHSLKALSLIEKINKTLLSSISIQHLYKAPTIAQLSELINPARKQKASDIVVPLKMEEASAKLLPIFFCHPASGLIYCFNHLVAQWQLLQPLYGLQDPGIAAGTMLYDSIHSMAAAYLSALKQIQPHGPYFLIGYSFGGTVLYEVAHLLQQEGEQIGMLALIEGWSVFSRQQTNEHHFKELFSANHQGLSSQLVDLAWARMQLLLNHKPSIMKQDMLLFKATQLFEEYQSINHPSNGWSEFNNGTIICYTMNANHETILNQDNCATIADIIQKRIYNIIE